MASRAATRGSRSRPKRLVGRVIAIRQRTGVSLVDVQVGVVDLPVSVTSLLGNELEQVSAAVPAAQGRKTPVSRQGGDDAVVGVEGVVGGTLQVLGDSTTNQEAIDAVGLGVVSCLVEGHQHQGVLGEVLVAQQGGHEGGQPVAGNGDVGVVGIVGHVGGDEHVLGDALVLQVLVEGGEVLDLAGAHGIVGDGVEQDQGVVLAHVLVGAALRVPVALVAGVGEVLLVLAPGDLLGVEQVGNGGDVGGQLVEVVVVHAEGLTGGGGTVVGLRRVSQGEVVGEEDTLLSQLGEVGIVRGGLVILF